VTALTAPHWADLVATRLRWGRDGAVTIGELAESMHVMRREVERAITALRAEGVPVCTGSAGVWLTTSPSELRVCYRWLRSKYIHQAIGARVLLQTAQRFERTQQTTLPWQEVA
jgi:hypothetical protein